MGTDDTKPSATAVRRPRVLTVAGAAALAVLAGFLLHTATSGEAEADTRGHRLAPPDRVGDYRAERVFRDTYVGRIRCSDQPSDTDCELYATEVRGIGITPGDADRIARGAVGSGALYRQGEPDAKDASYMSFRGLQGRVADPGAAVGRMFRSLRANEHYSFRFGAWDGPPRSFPLPGFEGAVMTCRRAVTVKETATDPAHRRTEEEVYCVWADHSTVAFVNRPGGSLTETADLTAELYRTARVRR
ncbi:MULTISPECIES: hypothetical protein [Streptomyces]|uniref:PknH-like extracellular domain-containing protein n=2 Tax=Streptomyces TaxID=1883 RepID=A0A117IX51_9ACTN|nr:MULTISPECIES: hypothetical protein [Streptomyces]KUH39995.1 hypothetical protein ATE80_04185 [Streptomyces kanasensis]UUS29602.1 hypothetical protein NRO40_01290 [Streptomyces changanensis]